MTSNDEINTHDSLCPTRNTRKNKHCACASLQQARVQAFSEGHYEGIMRWAWVCNDCGNTYGPEVIDCPNDTLDKLYARLYADKLDAFRLRDE